MIIGCLSALAFTGDKGKCVRAKVEVLLRIVDLEEKYKVTGGMKK